MTASKDIKDISSDEEEEYKDAGEESKLMEYGCQHYRRGCSKKCNECGEFFTCRFCHDEVKYLGEPDPKKSHEINRFAVKTVKCLRC